MLPKLLVSWSLSMPFNNHLVDMSVGEQYLCGMYDVRGVTADSLRRFARQEIRT